MKSTIKVLLCLGLICFSMSMRTRSTSESSLNNEAVVNTLTSKAAKRSGEVPSAPADPAPAGGAGTTEKPKSQTSEIYATLFTDPDRTVNTCEEIRTEEDRNQELQRIDYGGQTQDIPRTKINYNAEKKLGVGPSAYMYDHLDDILREDLKGEFSRIWGEAVALKPLEGIEDPYTLDKILGINRGSQMNTVPPKDQLLSRMKSFNPKFNEGLWEASLPLPVIARLVKEWFWFEDTSKNNPAKWVLDKYDYNGDGRLSPSELIIATIKNNKRIVENQGPKTCKNCLTEIIGKKIDPLYMYIDCGNMNMITAENIWKNFKQLKRKQPQQYNMYSCKLNSGSYRTTAVNDFVLKSQKSIDGKLTKEEFRLGVLIGYWYRETKPDVALITPSQIIEEKDTKRWDGNTKDIVCNKVLDAITNNK
jgi:hypothetical protein